MSRAAIIFSTSPRKLFFLLCNICVYSSEVCKTGNLNLGFGCFIEKIYFISIILFTCIYNNKILRFQKIFYLFNVICNECDGNISEIRCHFLFIIMMSCIILLIINVEKGSFFIFEEMRYLYDFFFF